MDEVRALAANTMQHMLEPLISAEAPLLARMRCRVLCTDSDPGFITSDSPVIWFDPDWYKKPPLFRSPAFCDPKLEITFPISPTQLLMLAHGETGFDYKDVPDAVVADLNRRARFMCKESFVVRRAYLEPSWFEPGKPPRDSWENTYTQESAEEDSPTTGAIGSGFSGC